LHLRRGDDGRLVVRRGAEATGDIEAPVARRVSAASPSGKPPPRAEVSAPLAAAIEGCAAEFGWVVPEFVASRLGAPCPPDELGRGIAALAAARGWPCDEHGWYQAAP